MMEQTNENHLKNEKLYKIVFPFVCNVRNMNLLYISVYLSV